jgi:hypothetical protein
VLYQSHSPAQFPNDGFFLSKIFYFAHVYLRESTEVTSQFCEDQALLCTSENVGSLVRDADDRCVQECGNPGEASVRYPTQMRASGVDTEQLHIYGTDGLHQCSNL